MDPHLKNETMGCCGCDCVVECYLGDFGPFMQTKTKLITGSISTHKSCAGESAAINTIYNNILAARRSRRAGRTGHLTTCQCAAESDFE